MQPVAVAVAVAMAVATPDPAPDSAEAAACALRLANRLATPEGQLNVPVQYVTPAPTTMTATTTATPARNYNFTYNNLAPVSSYRQALPAPTPLQPPPPHTPFYLHEFFMGITYVIDCFIPLT